MDRWVNEATTKEAPVIVQVREEGASGQGESSGNAEKWMDGFPTHVGGRAERT